MRNKRSSSKPRGKRFSKSITSFASAQKYGLETVTAVVVNGKVCSCCDNEEVNREDLKAAGIGTPL